MCSPFLHAGGASIHRINKSFPLKPSLITLVFAAYDQSVTIGNIDSCIQRPFIIFFIVSISGTARARATPDFARSLRNKAKPFPSKDLVLICVTRTFKPSDLPPTDYTQKKRGEPGLFSFEYNLSPKLIST